jgi:small-conductance mechanosensitive channel
MAKRLIVILWCLGFLAVTDVLYAVDLTGLLTGEQAETQASADRTIKTGDSAQDDRKIRRRLEEIFGELDALKNVAISVSKGVVTLSGEVDSTENMNKALQFTRQVEGVVDVQDELTINRSLPRRLERTQQKILEMGKQIVSVLPLFLLALIVCIVFGKLGGWISHRQSLFRRISPNYFIAGLLGQIAHLVLIVTGAVIALMLLDATAFLGMILGAAGIFGLAVGFAVRDTVENYIASILLSLRNPFEVNDLVNIDGNEGNVVRITSRATILISPDGNHIRIPNAIVFKAVITNFTLNPERRFEFDVGIDTDQDLLSAQLLALETLKNLKGVLNEPKPMVLIEQLGDSNVILRIHAWVDQGGYSFAKVRSEAIREVKQAFDSAGIVMPEPIYKLRVFQFDSEVSLPAQKPLIHADHKNIQDVAADRTVEKKVNEEQSFKSRENLLNVDAPKEL